MVIVPIVYHNNFQTSREILFKITSRIIMVNSFKAIIYLKPKIKMKINSFGPINKNTLKDYGFLINIIFKNLK